MLVMSCRYTVEEALQDPGLVWVVLPARAKCAGKMHNISKFAYLKMTLYAQL